MAKKQEVMHRKIRKIENIYFEGFTALHAVEVVIHYEYHYKPDPKTKELILQDRKIVNIEKNVLDFPLCSVTRAEIKEIRKGDIPSFVLKKDGNLYYAKLPKGGLLFTLENLPTFEHKCPDCGCLLAKTTKNGGCDKVYYTNAHIEDFRFITYGFESFNTGSKDSFIVIECNNYSTARLPRTYLSIEEINNLKLSLAQEIWEDAKSFAHIELLREQEKKKKMEMEKGKKSEKKTMENGN